MEMTCAESDKSLDGEALAACCISCCHILLQGRAQRILEGSNLQSGRLEVYRPLALDLRDEVHLELSGSSP